MSHTDAEIAGRTKKQLGGRMFCLMTGAKNFVALNGGGLSFKVGRNCEGVNRVSVLYDTASDLYGVEFGRLRGSQYKVLTKIDGVYCDQLQSVFTTHTGLETRI